MIIFKTTLKRIFKKRINKIVIFAAPIAFMLIAFNLVTSSTIRVAVADKDNTLLSKAIISGLQGKVKLIVTNEENMEAAIINNTAEYGIVIQQGFTDKLIKGEDVKIKAFRKTDGNTAYSIRLFIENYISAAKNIAKSANGNETLFYSTLKDYENGKLKSDIVVFGGSGGDGMKEKVALGMLGYCMLLITSFSTNLILEDKKNNTYTRMFATPLKNWSYMLQNVISIFLVVLLQVFIAFVFMMKVFKAQIGASPINMFIIFALYAAACVALGLAISSHSKNIKQASALSLLLNTLIGMFGGLFWPKEYMPDTLITIGKFTPAYWLSDGINKLLTSSSISVAAQDMGIILLFTIVFFMISSWKKVYIENV